MRRQWHSFHKKGSHAHMIMHVADGTCLYVDTDRKDDGKYEEAAEGDEVRFAICEDVDDKRRQWELKKFTNYFYVDW